MICKICDFTQSQSEYLPPGDTAYQFVCDPCMDRVKGASIRLVATARKAARYAKEQGNHEDANDVQSLVDWITTPPEGYCACGARKVRPEHAHCFQCEMEEQAEGLHVQELWPLTQKTIPSPGLLVNETYFEPGLKTPAKSFPWAMASLAFGVLTFVALAMSYRLKALSDFLEGLL